LATRICIIDDDLSFRRLCESILTPEGFSCEFVENASEAPAQIARTRPDLVIMDLRLGDEVEAVEILLAIKQAPSPTADIPVLICSASRDLIDTHMELLERLGCEVVDKPFGIDDLLAAIDRCLTPIQETNGAH
jgi:two-component system KDP operon response regulator KdpE